MYYLVLPPCLPHAVDAAPENLIWVEGARQFHEMTRPHEFGILLKIGRQHVSVRLGDQSGDAVGAQARRCRLPVNQSARPLRGRSSRIGRRHLRQSIGQLRLAPAAAQRDNEIDRGGLELGARGQLGLLGGQLLSLGGDDGGEILGAGAVFVERDLVACRKARTASA